MHILSLLIADAGDNPPPSITLSHGIPTEIAIALAGALLDYAVAYVPDPRIQNVLSGITLDFYECNLTFRGAIESFDTIHLIMKFSCPSALAEEYMAVQPSKILEWLEGMFSQRSQDYGDPTVRISVQHSTRHIESVAF